MPLNQTFQQFEKQLNRRFKLIGSASELRKFISNSSNTQGAALSVFLTGNIVTEGDFTLPSTISSLTINGGGKYGFLIKANSAAIDPLFTVPNGTKLTLEDCFIEAESTNGITSLFGAGSSNAYSDIVVNRSTFKNVAYVFKQAVCVIRKCILQDIVIEGTQTELVGYGITVGSGIEMYQCRFENIRTVSPCQITITMNIDTYFNQFENIDLNSGDRTSLGKNFFINIINDGTVDISAADYNIVQDATQYNQLAQLFIQNNDISNPVVVKVKTASVNHRTLQAFDTSTNATPLALMTTPTETNKAYLFEARIRGVSQGTFADDGAFIVRARYKNVTGSLVQLSNNIEYSSTSAAWSANFDKSGTNVVLFVTGSSFVNWTATVLSDEVS